MTDGQTASRVREVRLAGVGPGNLLDEPAVLAFLSDLQEANQDDTVVSIVIRGGEQHFSQGWHQERLADLGVDRLRSRLALLHRQLVPAIWHSEKFVIAAVAGDALGLACEVAALADVTIARTGVRMGHPEFRSGLMFPTVWPWLVGAKVAKLYLATGRILAGPALQETGLVNEVVGESDFEPAIEALVADLAGMPAGTVAANKRRIGWAWRDVSRALYDDTFYQVDEGWLIESRDIDYNFYREVSKKGVKGAIAQRDQGFSG